MKITTNEYTEDDDNTENTIDNKDNMQLNDNNSQSLYYTGQQNEYSIDKGNINNNQDTDSILPNTILEWMMYILILLAIMVMVKNHNDKKTINSH